MKRIRFAAVALICVMLLAGFVSRSEYDELARERDEWRTQVEKISQELDGLRNDLAELQSYSKELNEENEELREALSEAKKEITLQQRKIESFVSTIEKLEQENRSTQLWPGGENPLPAAGEGVQSVLDAFSELLELVGRPLFRP